MIAKRAPALYPAHQMKRKICMLGGFGVGKTSLVRRFVASIFSERYLTTVGVKIDKRVVKLAGGAVDLVIWDLQGEDAVRETPAAYLRGAAGYLLVADGTRRETLAVAETVHARAHRALGGVPFVLLLNKADLTGEWEMNDQAVAAFSERSAGVFPTSARTGEGVEEAFLALAKAMIE